MNRIDLVVKIPEIVEKSLETLSDRSSNIKHFLVKICIFDKMFVLGCRKMQGHLETDHKNNLVGLRFHSNYFPSIRRVDQSEKK